MQLHALFYLDGVYHVYWRFQKLKLEKSAGHVGQWLITLTPPPSNISILWLFNQSLESMQGYTLTD